MTTEKVIQFTKNSSKFVLAAANIVLLAHRFYKEYESEIKELCDSLLNSAKAITMK